MGFFSGKKKTVLDTTSTLLLSDTPNIVGDTVTTASIKDRPIASDLVANIIGGIGSKANSFYIYGKNKYVNGLPEGTVRPIGPPQAMLEKILYEREGNQAVDITYYEVVECDPDLIANDWLIKNRGYNMVSEEVSERAFLPDTPDGAVEVAFVTILDINRLAVEYAYTVGGEPKSFIEEFSVVPTNGDIESDTLFYHLAYRLRKAPTEPLRFWNYRMDTGTYPQLNLGAGSKMESPYYPVIPVCRKGENYCDPARLNSPDAGVRELYRTSRHLLNIIGVDIVDIGKSLFESSGEDDEGNPIEAPNPKDLDYGYVHIGVNLLSDVEVTQQYLYDYFKYLIPFSKRTKDDYDTYLTGTPKYNTITVAEGTFKMEFSFYYINEEIRTMNIGKVGTIKREYSLGGSTSESGLYISKNELKLIKQVSATQCSIISVMAPYYRNRVEGKHTIKCDLEDAHKGKDFILPVDRNVANAMGAIKKHELMYDAIRVTINTITTIKLKWYQTGVFKTLITVVAVVVSFYTAGGFTALSAAVMQAFVTNLVIAQIVGLAIEVGMKFLVDVVGLKGDFLTVVAAVVLVYAAIKGGNAAMSYLGTNPALATPTLAQNLIEVTNIVNKGLSLGFQQVMAEKMEGYEETLAKLQVEIDEAKEELESLEPNGKLSIEQLTNVGEDWIVAETPTQFFARSTLGNPGVLSLDEISTYVNRSLGLKGVANFNAMEIL